ncbi:hypothetical protein EJ04DRAFT_14300 [Polyplosphaeria fusca]|uniref:Uncharacterized protein n=1 Tax=Polyplosphaeria fusca TaxID=682080 RepID=A0A9P4QTB2_9PLEO|nr:hypothetical protein EJ04DRAFT_14300 [Polyplosphaeria fusca]
MAGNEEGVVVDRAGAGMFMGSLWEGGRRAKLPGKTRAWVKWVELNFCRERPMGCSVRKRAREEFVFIDECLAWLGLVVCVVEWISQGRCDMFVRTVHLPASPHPHSLPLHTPSYSTPFANHPKIPPFPSYIHCLAVPQATPSLNRTNTNPTPTPRTYTPARIHPSAHQSTNERFVIYKDIITKHTPHTRARGHKRRSQVFTYASTGNAYARVSIGSAGARGEEKLGYVMGRGIC